LQNPSILNATSVNGGTYTVTVTAITGCTNSANVSVVILSSTPTVNTSGSLCEGLSITLSTDTVFGGTYSWTGPNGFVSSSQNPVIDTATAATSGTYSLVVTAAGCTSATGTGLVTVYPIPSVPVASSNNPVCENSFLTLTTNTVTGATYSWTGPNGFTSSIADTSINNIGLVAAGSYSVTITITGCTSMPGITTVTVNTSPLPPSVSNNSPICEGLTLNFTAGSLSGVSYSWAGANGFTSSLQNPSVIDAPSSATGTYSLTVADSVYGCSSSIVTTTVTIYSKPQSKFGYGATCGSSTVTFNDSSTASSGNVNMWNWNFGDGNTSTTQNTSNNYSAFGTYTITLIVTSNLGCADTSMNSVTTSAAPPVAAFTTSTGATSYGLNQTIDFIDNSTGATSWLWKFGDGSANSTSQNPNHAYSQVGTYTVYLIVENGGNCSDSTYHSYIINNSNQPVAVPTGFTPNGDGENDVLYVRGGPFVEIEFKVYNEWGNVIFESNDQKSGWDGNYKGAKQPAGVYIYTLKGTTVNNDKIDVSNDVHLLR